MPIRPFNLLVVVALIAALVVSSVAAPGLVGNIGAGTTPVAVETASDAPGATVLPAMPLTAPASRAFGLYVSGSSSGSVPLFGPSPLATAATTNGRGEERAIGAEVFVRSLDGTKVLAHVTGLKAIAAVNTVTTTNATTGVTTYWAAQARGHARVTSAILLDGQVEARLLQSDTFGSANQRNATVPFRFDAGNSRVAEVYVMGVKLAFPQATAEVPITGVGVLYLNQTITDQATGTIENYALRLKLNSGMDIVVSGTQVKVGRQPLGAQVNCLSYSEAYPVGTTLHVLNDVGDARHNLVMADPPVGLTELHGSVNDVPIDSLGVVVRAGVARADNDNTITASSSGARTSAVVQRLDLLNGLVTADLVRAHANAGVALGPGSAGLQAEATGSVLVGLKVSTTVVQQSPQVNTTIPVLVGGTLVAELHLNEQTVVANSDLATGVHTALQRTNMIRLVVVADGLGVPVGTQIVVGHAISLSMCGENGRPTMPPLDFGDPLRLRA